MSLFKKWKKGALNCTQAVPHLLTQLANGDEWVGSDMAEPKHPVFSWSHEVILDVSFLSNVLSLINTDNFEWTLKFPSTQCFVPCSPSETLRESRPVAKSICPGSITEGGAVNMAADNRFSRSQPASLAYFSIRHLKWDTGSWLNILSLFTHIFEPHLTSGLHQIVCDLECRGWWMWPHTITTCYDVTHPSGVHYSLSGLLHDLPRLLSVCHHCTVQQGRHSSLNLCRAYRNYFLLYLCVLLPSHTPGMQD